MYFKVLEAEVTVWQIMAWFWVGVWCVVYMVHLLALIYGKNFLYSWREVKDTMDTDDLPTVSIIKTIAGKNHNSLRNLEVAFQLEYPKLFEVLICVNEEKSELLPHLIDLKDKYPHVDCTIFSDGAHNIGVNPKINNMMQCYDKIKYEYFWICDSNIVVHKDSLLEIGHSLKDDIGMLHQMPYMANSVDGFGGTLDKVYFGTQHARWYLALYALGFTCTNGMSSVIRKKDLDAVGGLKAFSKYIAEDFFMGMSFQTRGIKIGLSTEPALQNPNKASLESYLYRMIRWQKLRITMLPTTFVEPFIECFMLGALASLSLHYLGVVHFIVVFLAHVFTWFTLDTLLMCVIEGWGTLPPLGTRVRAWLTRELYTYYIFVVALYDRNIRWNQTTFALRYGGLAVNTGKQS